MTREELVEARDGICKQLGVEYWVKYTRPQTAATLKKDETTLKRWEKKKKIFPVLEPGEKGIGYFGWQIADIYMGRAQPWVVSLEENSSLDDTTSPSEQAPPPGTDAGGKVTPPDASASARRILKRRSGS